MNPFRERLQRDKLDVIVASRYRSGATISGVPPIRRLMSRGAGVLFKLLHPISGIRDYSCGYRLYTRELLERAVATWGSDLIEQRGFASMVELLLKLGKMGAKAGEIPLQLRYDQKRGEGKLPVAENSTRLLKLMWKWRRSGLEPKKRM